MTHVLVEEKTTGERQYEDDDVANRWEHCLRVREIAAPRRVERGMDARRPEPVASSTFVGASATVAPMVRVFGLTGGIGSGKSTVAARWRARGVSVIDADQLAREVVAPGTPGVAEIVAAFGPTVVAADGSLDRHRLGALAFATDAARRTLESITHPRITTAAEERIREAERSGAALVCYEAALIIERGRADLYRPLVVVCAPEDEQVRRALGRGDQDETQVRTRMAAQLPNEQKRRIADITIDNDGSREALEAAADRALDEVCERLGVARARSNSNSNR